MVMVRVLFWIDVHFEWKSPMHAETARAVLATMASSMFTFVVFVSSALLVAVQLASANSRRESSASFFNRPSCGFVVAFRVHLYLLPGGPDSHHRLRSVADRPVSPPIVAWRVSPFFLFLIDHVGKSLRPSGALALGRGRWSCGHQERLSAHPWRKSTRSRPSVTQLQNDNRLSPLPKTRRRGPGFRHCRPGGIGPAHRLHH